MPPSPEPPETARLAEMTPTSAASLLQVIGAGPAAHHPSAVHCYVGRAAEDLDFSGLDGVVPAQVSDGFGVGVGVAVAVGVGVVVGCWFWCWG